MPLGFVPGDVCLLVLSRALELIMQGASKVIEYLNKGLRHELTAINQ